MGKFEPRKNHILLLRAVKELSQEFDLRLTIIGECTTDLHRRELERIHSFLRDQGLEKIVTIRLNLPFSEVQFEYTKHDLFVLPSRDEPAAVSILEAMAQGLPVICSDSNGTQCYIDQGRNGFVFRTDDLQDLIEKIRMVISDRERLVNMGHYSYRLVVERYQPKQYEQAIREVVGKV